jgi:hypothetical protein
MPTNAGPSAARTRHRPSISRGPAPYIGAALIILGLALGFLLWKRTVLQPAANSDTAAATSQWTDQMDQLKLIEDPVRGRLKGWGFTANKAFWRDTRLILRQDGGDPAALRLVVTFPLKGGELVPGKSFCLGPGDSPFDPPPKLVWKDEGNRDRSETLAPGYLLLIRFDEVSKDRVAGRLHLCFPDAEHSWVAGSFSAANQTRVK